MAHEITDIGEVGSIGGMLRPIDFTLLRNVDGVVWNLTGYTSPELRVWEYRTKTAIAITGTATIESPATDGVVRYTPAAADPLYAASGTYEARIWVTPGSGDPEPSGVFRFQIGDGPPPS